MFAPSWQVPLQAPMINIQLAMVLGLLPLLTQAMLALPCCVRPVLALLPLLTQACLPCPAPPCACPAGAARPFPLPLFPSCCSPATPTPVRRRLHRLCPLALPTLQAFAPTSNDTAVTFVTFDGTPKTTHHWQHMDAPLRGGKSLAPFGA